MKIFLKTLGEHIRIMQSHKKKLRDRTKQSVKGNLSKYRKKQL